MADLDIEDIKKKKINISVENLVLLGAGLVSLIGMWFALQGDIKEAKELPIAPVSRTEYDLKDQAIRTSILSTEKKVDENSVKLDKIDEKLYEIIKRN
jgi:uncharacterized protein (UPF0333 family)